MIVFGIALLIIAAVVPMLAILWGIGIIVLVVGVILAVLGTMGRAVGGRRHYYQPCRALDRRAKSQACLAEAKRDASGRLRSDARRAVADDRSPPTCNRFGRSDHT